MAGLFKRGYKEVEKVKKQQEEAREQMQNQVWRFFIKDDGGEADVRFLTEEPVNFYEHTEQVFRNGKENYDSTTCAGEDCPLCESGNRPTFRGAYLIVDRREFEFTKDGKKHTGKDQIRLYVQGTRVLSQLDRISERYGLSNRDVTIVRLGKGTSTTYTVERGEEKKMTRKEIENLLPDHLKEKYDGTMESLYSIVEEQLQMSLPDGFEDEDDEPVKARSALISTDDEDDEDDLPFEEEVKVKPKPKPLKKLGRPKENSIKSLLKG